MTAVLMPGGPVADAVFADLVPRIDALRAAGHTPGLATVLIGDDGQHDQEIYGDFVASHPGNVAAVAIRQLSATQTVLAGGLPAHVDGSASTVRHGRPWMSAPDGAGLARQMNETDLL